MFAAYKQNEATLFYFTWILDALNCFGHLQWRDSGYIGQ